MSGPDIFISYCRDDQGMARLFAEAFTQEGLSVWWDAALHSGQTFDEVIEKELRAAKAVVVLWSPRSVASRWVRAEATLADRSGTLAPAIIEPCDRPIIFELTHTVDLSHWNGDVSDDAWRNFVSDIHRLVESKRAAEAAGGPSAPSPVAEARRAPARPAPPPQPAGGMNRIANDALAGGNVEGLISALTNLQQAMQKQDVPVPAPEIEFDDDEATQILTGADAFGFGESDELHCLELTIGDDPEVKRFVVGPLGLKLGRTAPADVVLADSKVSRSHCTVELKDGQLFVTDLNSTNGTFVDDERVEGAAILPVGGVLRVGHCALQHEVRTREEVSV